jgi:predicted secreted protein
VNQAISEAVKRVQKEPTIAMQTLGYESYPDYQNGKSVGWQVRQSLRLVSHNPELLAKLIGELQSSLALGSMEYSVSPDKLRQFEDKLLDQGLSDFRARAERITKDMGRTRYRVVGMQLNTPGQPQFRPQMQMKSMAADAGSPFPPPPLQAKSMGQSNYSRTEMEHFEF